MNFHIGQKVVCIRDDSDLGGLNAIEPTLKVGAIYTIKSTGQSWETKELTLRVGTVPVDGWLHSRFRLLVERKTSIEIFQKIRKDVEQSVPVKEASNV